MKHRIFSLLFLFLLQPVSPAYAQQGAIPESASVPGVVGRPQTFMLSCESRSAVDFAAFWGLSLSESEFLARLPRSDNPEAGFVGNPSDAWGNIPPYSYGVHAAPVADLLRRYGLRVQARRGLQWDDLRIEIAAGRPVIVWVIGAMWPGKTVRYTASDGTKTTVARFEHTMILVGYDAAQVQVIDAYSGLRQAYSLATFQASWEVLGNMAVLGKGKKPSVPQKKTLTPKSSLGLRAKILLPFVSGLNSDQTPAHSAQPPRPRPALPETYTVKRGDYLIALADQFGLDWRILAEINHLTYPFVLYPGQVLKLRK